MAILTPTSVKTNELSLAQKQFQLAASTKRDAQILYMRILSAQHKGIDDIWHSPAMTPHEAVAALGKEAKTFFISHGIITDLCINMAILNGIPPDVKGIPEGWTYTLNDDGTVSVAQVEPTV